MQKKLFTFFGITVLTIVGLAVAVGWFSAANTENWTPDNPLDGVMLGVGGTSTAASISLSNGSDRSIVVSLHDRPPVLETKVGEEWQRIISTRLPNTSSDTVEVGEVYSLSFQWEDLYGGMLRGGEYRLLFYYGDGSVPTDEFYSSAARFVIE